MARARRRGALRTGTSGFQYDDWRGRFYPRSLPRSRWLEHYAQHFDTVEINNTFYGLPSAQAFDRWRAAAPPGFRFALKYSRFGSHVMKLREPRRHLERFLERAERLGRALGPILVQLPPGWRADPLRLDAFLAAAPRRRRFAVEFRDRSWLCEEVYDVLRRRRAALCVHDLIDRHPRIHTAGWVYLRFHGPDPEAPCSGGYSPQALGAAARRIRADLAEGFDVYAYFNNDVRGHAVADALALRRMVRKPGLFFGGRSHGSTHSGSLAGSPGRLG